MHSGRTGPCQPIRSRGRTWRLHRAPWYRPGLFRLARLLIRAHVWSCRRGTPHVWLGSTHPRSQCVGGMLLVQWCYRHVLNCLMTAQTSEAFGLLTSSARHHSCDDKQGLLSLHHAAEHDPSHSPTVRGNACTLAHTLSLTLAVGAAHSSVAFVQLPAGAAKQNNGASAPRAD